MSGNGSDVLRGPGRAAADPSRATASRRPARNTPVPGPRAGTAALVGRERQIAALTALLGRLREGQGGALVLTGEPGTGKSALLGHVRSLLGDEVRVLTSGTDDGRRALAGLHRLLLPVRGFADELPAAQRAALAADADRPDAGGRDPYPVALAALNLLAEAGARGPVVMVVDDMDRLDAASFTALGFIARRLASEPLVLLGAIPEIARHQVEDIGLPVLTLGPLGGRDAADLVDRQAPGLPSGLRERVLTQAGGNPRALGRLARAANRSARRYDGWPAGGAGRVGWGNTPPHAAGPAAGTGRHDAAVRPPVPAAGNQPRARRDPEPFAAGVPCEDPDAALVALARRMAAAGDGALALRVLSSAAVRVFWAEAGPDAGRRIAAVGEQLPVVDEPRLLAVLAATSPVGHGARVAAGLRHWADHPNRDAATDLLLGSAALMAGSFEMAASFSAAAVSGLRTTGRPGPLARALTTRAMSAALLCDLPVAASAAAEAARLSQETGQPLLYASARAAQSLAAALGGLSDEAQARAEEAIGLATALHARPALATATATLAHLAAARHDTGTALGHLLRLHDPASAAFHPVLCHYWLIDLADTALLAHRTDEVRGVVDRMARNATRTPATALHIGVRFARAALADGEDAGRLFASALGADLTRWPFARARTQLAHGEWLRRRRRDAQARTPLRAARDAFDALGATGLADRARGELRASGEASTERAPDVRNLLNPQELQIALMVAEGLTNREIGERLYLSHRTVSSHLHRVYPRLGVTSRTALCRLLRSAGAAG